MKNYPVEINLNGKIIIEVNAESRAEAERIAKETFEDSKVKDALVKYKNSLVITSKVKNELDYER